MDVTRPRATKASQITWDVAAALVASLENGGVNEISVAGLSGALADNQPFDESRIENGGAQEINLAGLAGIGPNDLPNSNNQYLISDAVKHSHDAQVETSASALEKLKTMEITDLFTTPKTLRIHWEYRCTGAGVVYCKIYKNGVAHGAEESNNTTDWEVEDQDLSFANGNDIQIYGYTFEGATTGQIKNFQVRGEDLPLTYHEIVDDNIIGLADPFTATNTTP